MRRVFPIPDGPAISTIRVPTAADCPNIRVFDLEQYPSPNNPLGAKGAGEGGVVPVAAVIASAVASAIGVQPKALPLSATRVWELMNA